MKTEIITIDNEFPVFCVTAISFPEGILAAHRALHDICHERMQRTYYGISFRDATGKITYKAATGELYAGELQQHRLELFTIRSGRYLATKIEDYENHIPQIATVFQALLTHPDLDPNGYCLEWYNDDKDLVCSVKLI